MHKQYLLQFVGFQTRAFAICDSAAEENRHSTGTLEDATLRYSCASWHKMGMLLLLDD